MTYINGFLLGMTLQLSLGPVFFAVTHKAVTEGGKEDFKMSLGAAIIDSFYIALSFTGIVLLLQIRFMQSLLLAAGSIILFIFGMRYILKAKSAQNDSCLNTISVAHEASGQVKTGSLVYGLKLTAVNPLTIVFWSGTFGALMASGVLGGLSESLVFAAGSVSATVFFLGLVSYLAPLVPFKRNRKTELFLDYIVATVLFIFSGIMIFRLFSL